MLDLRQQMEEMTQSLTNSDIAATPNSVQSLNFDNSQTPTAPMTPESTTPTTPTNAIKIIENDLKINDLTITSKTRPEYLTNLTKLAMKSETPKFTSTPKIVPEKVEDKVDNLKGVIFKPKTVAKRNLKPLELKTNLNNISLDTNDNEKEDNDKTPVADVEKLLPVKPLDKDKTPVSPFLRLFKIFAEKFECKLW